MSRIKLRGLKSFLNSKFWDIIKTVIVTVLFISMVVLALMYITNTQQMTLNPENFVDIESLLVLKENELMSDDSVMRCIRVVPEFIGYKNLGVSKGIFGSPDLIEYVYETVSEYIAYAIGENSKCVKYSAEDGATVWNSCVKQRSLVYVRYHTSLPAPYISAYSSGGDESAFSNMADGDIMYILELFVVQDKDQDTKVFVRSEDGEVAEYVMKNGIDEDSPKFDISHFSAYNDNKDFIPFEFFGNISANTDIYKLENLHLSSSTVLTDEISSNAQLNATECTLDFLVSTDAAENIVSAFSYNPSHYGKYEGSDVVSYIDAIGTLDVYDGYLSFDSSENGIGLPISDYLGYEIYGGKYTLNEVIVATAVLSNKLGKIESIGGDIDIKLLNLSYSDGTIHIEYGCLYDNVLILNSDGSPYIIMEYSIKEGKIVNSTVRAVTFKAISGSVANLPQYWSLKIINDMLSEKSDEFMLKLGYSYESNVKSIYTKWIAFTVNGLEAVK